MMAAPAHTLLRWFARYTNYFLFVLYVQFAGGAAAPPAALGIAAVTFCPRQKV
jgi:hypothetical protein